MLGPQPKYLALTLVIKLTMFAMYASVVVPNYPISLFLLIGIPCLVLMIYLLLKTAFRDPGIIAPRISDEEDGNLNQNSPLSGSSPPDSVSSRYCYTCHIQKPPRSKHCKHCDVCINQMDHHCPFIGSCIGIRNYRYFFGYIFIACVSNWFIFILTLNDLMVFFRSAKGGVNSVLDYTFRNKPVHTILFLLCIGMIVCLTALVFFHFYLICTRQSTKEAWIRFGLIPPPSQDGFQNANERNSLSFLDHLKVIFWNPLPPSHFGRGNSPLHQR